MCLLKGPRGPIPNCPEIFGRRNWNVMTRPKLLGSTWKFKARRIIIRVSSCGCIYVSFLQAWACFWKVNNVCLPNPNWVQMLNEMTDEVSVQSLAFLFFPLLFCHDSSLHSEREIQLYEYLGFTFVLYALSVCVCVTGHKQAGMFLLEDFQPFG